MFKFNVEWIKGGMYRVVEKCREQQDEMQELPQASQLFESLKKKVRIQFFS